MLLPIQFSAALKDCVRQNYAVSLQVRSKNRYIVLLSDVTRDCPRTREQVNKAIDVRNLSFEQCTQTIE
jgi:hypothetical protein